MDADLLALYNAGTNAEKLQALSIQATRNGQGVTLPYFTDVKAMQQTVVAEMYSDDQNLYTRCFTDAMDACKVGMTGVGKFTMDALRDNATYLATQLYLKAKANIALIAAGQPPV